MAYNKRPNPGQATMANSEPVVIASDQSAIPVTATNLDVQSGGADLATSTQAAAIQTSVELIDDAVATLGTTTYTEATTKGITIGAVRRDANTTLVGTTNEVAPLQVNATGELKVAQIAALPTGSNVIGGVTMAANATTSPAKARDGVAGANDTGIPAQFVRRDTPTAVTPIAGDYEFAQIDANGSQWVRLAGEVADDGAFTVGTTRVVPVGKLADETATDSVDEGDIGISRMTLDRKAIITPYAHTAGGATPYDLISAASTNATSVKASAGQVYNLVATNTNAAVRYLKLYNLASAPTVGTSTPVQVYMLAPNGGVSLTFPVGMAFSTGIALAITTGAADADTGAVAANEVIVNMTFI